jgi:PAS domain S-box-containing protein
VSLSALLAEAILSARSDAIIAADNDGIIRFWNPGAERIFGYSGNEALGQSLDLIIPERLRQRHWDGYRRVMETAQSRYGESDVLKMLGRNQSEIARVRGSPCPPILSQDQQSRRYQPTVSFRAI